MTYFGSSNFFAEKMIKVCLPHKKPNQGTEVSFLAISSLYSNSNSENIAMISRNTFCGCFTFQLVQKQFQTLKRFDNEYDGRGYGSYWIEKVWPLLPRIIPRTLNLQTISLKPWRNYYFLHLKKINNIYARIQTFSSIPQYFWIFFTYQSTQTLKSHEKILRQLSDR